MTLKQKIENMPLDESKGFKQIGLTLKEGRRSKGRSIKEISEQLRISVDYLTKLEAGAFGELPAPAYVTGFIRSYGRVDEPDLLVARYLADSGGDSKPNYKTPMSTRPPQRSAPAVASMLVLSAGLAYGGWFWLKTMSPPVSDAVVTGSETVMLSSNQEDSAIDPAVTNLTNTIETPAVNQISEMEVTSANSVLGETEILENQDANIGSWVPQNEEIDGEGRDVIAVQSQIPALLQFEVSNSELLDELETTQI